MSKQTPLAAVQAISHFAVEVSDIARSTAFYERVLGLDIFQDDRTHPDQPSVKGLISGLAVELNETRSSSNPQAARERLGGPILSQGIAFTVDDAEGVFDRLKAIGCVEAAAVTHFQGAKMFYVADPDGHVFELIEFPPGLRTLADLEPLLRGSTR